MTCERGVMKQCRPPLFNEIIEFKSNVALYILFKMELAFIYVFS